MLCSLGQSSISCWLTAYCQTRQKQQERLYVNQCKISLTARATRFADWKTMKVYKYRKHHHHSRPSATPRRYSVVIHHLPQCLTSVSLADLSVAFWNWG